jgi:hypothetical protein
VNRAAIIVAALVACGKTSSAPGSAGSGSAPPPSNVVSDTSNVASTASCENVLAKLETMRGAPHGALDELAQPCREWSMKYRECILAIATKDEISTCDREALLARGVDLGGPACEQVMEHFATVEKLPADVYQKTKQKLLAACGALPRGVKECSLAATDHAGLAACAAQNHESAR